MIELGKSTGEDLSPLAARVQMPTEWRALLLIPRQASGVSGDDERAAFARLPPTPLDVTESLNREAFSCLAPAAVERDFATFSASLYRFGQLAGGCFASEQHGTARDAQTARAIERLRGLGIEGVAQTSWGPTLVAVLPDEASAQALAERLAVEGDLERGDYECVVTPFTNTGGQIEITER